MEPAVDRTAFDPSVAVDPALLVPADVHLVVRAVREMTVAGRLHTVVLGSCRARSSEPRSPGRAERFHRPAARHLADPEQVLLERHPQDQPQRTSVRAPGEVELEHAAVVGGAALGHGHPRAVVGVRGEQRRGRVAPQVLPPTTSPAASWTSYAPSTTDRRPTSRRRGSCRPACRRPARPPTVARVRPPPSDGWRLRPWRARPGCHRADPGSS